MKATKTILVITGIMLISFLILEAVGQTTTQQTKKIKWYTIQEAEKANMKAPKKIFISVYTTWCGWCRKMDNSTFLHPVIVDYMNTHYYPVKLDAETKDTIKFNGKTYINPNPYYRNSANQLATYLLQGYMSYPSFVFLDENLKTLTIVKGYQTAKQIEPMLKFFGENAYKTDDWQNYLLNFKGEIE